MTQIGKNHLSFAILILLIGFLGLLVIGNAMKNTAFYIMSGICILAAGLCLFGWIYMYLKELDDRLKQIENK